MLINLVPDFLAVLADASPEAAWQRYFETHSAVLTAYWRNYVLEPGSPAASEVVRTALAADRSDLHALLAGVDVVQGDRYGRLALSDAGLRRRERHVLESCRRAGLPVAITIAGGYATTPERTAELHAIVFEEARARFG